MRFTITAEVPEADELVGLYRSVEWSMYTADPARLHAAVHASHHVLAARDESGALVGLLRTLSDGLTIVYIQDVLVTPSHQRAFYESRGLRETQDFVPKPLRSFVLIR